MSAEIDFILKNIYEDLKTLQTLYEYEKISMDSQYYIQVVTALTEAESKIKKSTVNYQSRVSKNVRKEIRNILY